MPSALRRLLAIAFAWLASVTSVPATFSLRASLSRFNERFAIQPAKHRAQPPSSQLLEESNSGTFSFQTLMVSITSDLSRVPVCIGERISQSNHFEDLHVGMIEMKNVHCQSLLYAWRRTPRFKPRDRVHRFLDYCRVHFARADGEHRTI